MPAGSEVSARLVHPWKALRLIDVSPAGSCVAVMLVQPWKAYESMNVSEFGNAVNAILVQPWNACGPTYARAEGSRVRANASP